MAPKLRSQYEKITSFQLSSFPATLLQAWKLLAVETPLNISQTCSTLEGSGASVEVVSYRDASTYLTNLLDSRKFRSKRVSCLLSRRLYITHKPARLSKVPKQACKLLAIETPPLSHKPARL
jgi:hypothetical protein